MVEQVVARVSIRTLGATAATTGGSCSHTSCAAPVACRACSVVPSKAFTLLNLQHLVLTSNQIGQLPVRTRARVRVGVIAKHARRCKTRRPLTRDTPTGVRISRM